MNNLKKRPLEKELTFLSYMELITIFSIVIIYFLSKFVFEMNWGNKPFILRLTSFYPLSLLAIILLEGSCYWFNCLNKVKKKEHLTPFKMGQIYLRLQRMNWVLFVVYIPIVVYALVMQQTEGIIIGVVFFIAAIIEQINYFYTRLSYETTNGGLLIIKPATELFSGKGKQSKINCDIHLYLEKSKNEQ